MKAKLILKNQFCFRTRARYNHVTLGVISTQEIYTVEYLRRSLKIVVTEIRRTNAILRTVTVRPRLRARRGARFVIPIHRHRVDQVDSCISEVRKRNSLISRRPTVACVCFCGCSSMWTDPKHLRVGSRMIRSILVLVIVICTAPRAMAGVVQIAAGHAPAPADTSSAIVSAPAPAMHVDEPVGIAVGVADKVSPAASSGWTALLDSASRDAAAASDSHPLQNVSIPIANASAPGAVIPLPPAVWSGFVTLGAAGWFGLHRRARKFARLRRLPAFHQR
jgi:hypothetical protein